MAMDIDDDTFEMIADETWSSISDNDYDEELDEMNTNTKYSHDDDDDDDDDDEQKRGGKNTQQNVFAFLGFRRRRK
jgi:hypothetical protein